ncbi:FtsW/RodA/SpoVE family cell cycle protein [Oxobacter pfennigii]|uniref:FtsW/RodA/SpoVE family cell cycle protein n=1 Tax=Oxobacter pfennigii TaxID=36849 RepID=UPI0006D3FE37|nr:FtsW/RodA/SpoVE family cell cycle protein [Oxobacter pfennigii]
MDNRKEEKRILSLVYGIGIIAFSIIGLYNNDSIAYLIGIFSVVLIGYGHFIISRYFPDGDKYLFVLAAFLAEMGLVMLYRINPYYAIRQITWLTVGVAVFILIVVLFPDMEGIKDFKYYYLAAAIGLLVLTQVFGSDIRGSKNWINLGFIGFQPSEFSKVFLILYLASELHDFKDRKGLIMPAAAVLVSLIFLVLQKDLGSALIFFGISITMVYIATPKIKYVLSAVVLFLIGGAGSYFVFSHVRNRVNIWINPWKDPNGAGYQVVQSLFAIAWGGLMGTGLNLGYPKYIPEVHTDFIFAIVCEEFGLLGGFAVIIAYFLLVYRGMRTAIYSEDNFTRLVAVGISTMIGAQVFVIIGGVIKLIPLTGITLPLMSYGGSSFVINFIALGILQKISENTK